MDNESTNLWAGWWRWPLIPVASILGAFLGGAAFFLLQWLSMKLSGRFDESGWYFQYILPLLRDGLYGFLAIYFGCIVAPRGKLIVGVVITTVIAALFLVGAILKIKGVYEISGFGLASGIVMLIGAVIGVIQTHDK